MLNIFCKILKKCEEFINIFYNCLIFIATKRLSLFINALTYHNLSLSFECLSLFLQVGGKHRVLVNWLIVVYLYNKENLKAPMTPVQVLI